MVDTQHQSSSNPFASEHPVISVDGVSKKFCRDLKRSLFYGVQDIAADLTGGRRNTDRLRSREFWALNSVSFQLYPGQALGMIGTNGAGKSTLLRIISSLIKPDTGSVRIRGRLAPLIALGAGFNPILTGRENIYANMSILGLSTRQIEERFQAVVDFAEIHDAIDAPVQTYSSGMSARLGFACAIHTEPDILLIDEVLAVGDARFKAKCYRRLYELRQKGVAFILVNHSSQAILNICTQAIYLSKGQVVGMGEVETIVAQYEQDLFVRGIDTYSNQLTLPPKPLEQSCGIDICSLFFRNGEGVIIEDLMNGQPLTFCVSCLAHRPYQNISLQIKITRVGGEDSATTVLFLSGVNDNIFFDLPKGRVELNLEFPYLALVAGTYSMNIKLQKDSLYIFDLVQSFRFTVNDSCNLYRCQFYQPHQWSFKAVSGVT